MSKRTLVCPREAHFGWDLGCFRKVFYILLMKLEFPLCLTGKNEVCPSATCSYAADIIRWIWFVWVFFFNTLQLLVGFGILLAWALEMLFCIYSFSTCKAIHCGSFWKRWKLLPFPERKASVSWWDCAKSASTMARELLVNSKEVFKQNRKRVLNHWSHKHEKKVQVMVWPTPEFSLSCFLSFSSLQMFNCSPKQLMEMKNHWNEDMFFRLPWTWSQHEKQRQM